MKKLRLRMENLAVDSFRTDEAAHGALRGTVHGQAPCTWFNSCQCPSARYCCGADSVTAYSCATDANCPTQEVEC